MGRREGRERERGRRRGGFRRALSLLAFLPVASRIPTYSRLIWALVRDARTPTSRKVVLAAALGYLVAGRDLVPDDIPVLGGLDDLAVVVLAVDLFLEGVPEAVLGEQLDTLGIDRDAFEADVARIRRLTPGPLRRVLHGISGAVDGAERLASATRLGPRIRRWIAKEESFA